MLDYLSMLSYLSYLELQGYKFLVIDFGQNNLLLYVIYLFAYGLKRSTLLLLSSRVLDLSIIQPLTLNNEEFNT